MTYIYFQLLKNLTKVAIYLLLIGKITSCTGELKAKSGKELQRGIVSLKRLNKSLHSR